MKHSMAFLLALVLLLTSFCFAIPISAEEQELKDVSLDELVEIVKGAVYFDLFIYVKSLQIPYCPDEEWKYGDNSPYTGEFRQWLKEHDFWMDHINVKTFDCIEFSDGINAWELPLGVTKESLEKVLKEYYASDFCGYLENILTPKDLLDQEKRKWAFYPLICENGKMYRIMMDYLFVLGNDYPIFDTAKILSKTSTKITLQFEFEEFKDKTTVDLIKTSSGWRVSGGSLFDYMRRPGYHPPETGDSTTPYFALATLSFLALPFAAVALSRKRKRL